MIYKYMCIYILENKPAFFPQLLFPFRKQASEQNVCFPCACLHKNCQFLLSIQAKMYKPVNENLENVKGVILS